MRRAAAGVAPRRWHPPLAALLALALLAGRPAEGAPASAPASGPSGGAAPEARLVIVEMRGCCPTEAWPEAEEATRREFLALGFLVEVAPGVAGDEGQRRRELARVAAAHGATAALLIVRRHEDGPGVEIWLEDRLTGKTVVRHYRILAASVGEASRIAGLKAVEAMRASLIELNLARPATGGVSAPAAAQRLVPIAPLAPDAPPPPSRVGLRVGGGIIAPTGILGARGALQVAARWEPWRYLALELDGLMGLGGARLTAADAAATCELALVRGWALWTPGLGGPVRPALGLGAGLAGLWSEGLVSPARTRSDSTLVAWLGGGAQVGLAMTRWLRVTLEAHVGALLPEVRVRFGAETVTRLGRPLVDALAGLELRLP